MLTYTLIYEWLGEFKEVQFKFIDEASAHCSLLLKHGVSFNMVVNKGE